MHQFHGILPTHGRQASFQIFFRPARGRTGLLVPPKNVFMESFNCSKDLLRVRMQVFSPPRALTVKTPHSDVRREVDKDWVEGNISSNITSGTERGQARAGGTPFVQKSITRGVKDRGALGGRVLDYHREIAHQEMGRMKNDKFIFPAAILCDTGQCRVFKRQQKRILTSNQSVSWFRSGSGSCLRVCLTRRKLSPLRRFAMDSLSRSQGTIRIGFRGGSGKGETLGTVTLSEIIMDES